MVHSTVTGQCNILKSFNCLKFNLVKVELDFLHECERGDGLVDQHDRGDINHKFEMKEL